MKRWGLCILRISTGWLLVMWGLDKLVDVDHGVAVADAFYFGIGSSALFLSAFGVLEAVLGVLVVLGLWRRRVYPVMFLILGVTAVAVWRSVLDPWAGSSRAPTCSSTRRSSSPRAPRSCGVRWMRTT